MLDEVLTTRGRGEYVRAQGRVTAGRTTSEEFMRKFAYEMKRKLERTEDIVVSSRAE